MNKLLLFLFFASAIFVSCNDDDATPAINNPDSYSFERTGNSTVSFEGQTTRIGMATELGDNLSNLEATEDLLLELFRNETVAGGDANPFTDESLNASDINIKSKTAASNDYFLSNTVESNAIRSQFEEWIVNQVNEVFANKNVAATPGTAGQIADGSRTRYVSALGFEYNQRIKKGLLGALMTDQMLNNYLSTAVLDADDNRSNNSGSTLEDGENFTTMEHLWDEAYGYLYGQSADSSNPNLTIGDDDDFLNEYVGVVNRDADFEGIADDIYNAFKLGRAAIVAKQYEIRDAQAEIIKANISKVIAVRAVHYLQGGKESLPTNRADYTLYGHAMHELSEGFGFVYSLRFTRQPNSNQPYFSKEEVDGFMEDILSGANGLWDVDGATLDQISETIAAKFGFTVDQAAL